VSSASRVVEQNAFVQNVLSRMPLTRRLFGKNIPDQAIHYGSQAYRTRWSGNGRKKMLKRVCPWNGKVLFQQAILVRAPSLSRPRYPKRVAMRTASSRLAAWSFS
jgi:hypothetical protein